ncbi:MAG: hypothetical protein AYP45_13920 [Candidatus Brocadia carolinensis]|uniref:Uncharacterized protein n=1 Tax=Candidatus Brocadia carolinensis TaxID=1004156 RepID=A0A1V4AR40_9BACT|nr:MAG: hypothetical protein AYP45_13920 [Candidatus Brocadia caroliniensis]
MVYRRYRIPVLKRCEQGQGATALSQDFCDTVFPTKVLFLEVFNGKIILIGNLFGMWNYLVPQDLGELRVIKDTVFCSHRKDVIPFAYKKG